MMKTIYCTFGLFLSRKSVRIKSITTNLFLIKIVFCQTFHIHHIEQCFK